AGVVTATESRAQYLQDQLHGVINSPLWKFLRRVRGVAVSVLGPFPRMRKMLGILAREGPGGVARRLKEGAMGDAAYSRFLERHPFTDQDRAKLIARIDALKTEEKPLISIVVPVY